jgi:hypothetical protein
VGIKDVLDRLEEEERRFAGTLFLAPVLPGRGVMVRIAGIQCQVERIQGLPEPDFAGWAVLRALSPFEAAFQRPAGLKECAEYLALFPAVRLILLEPAADRWLAVPALRGDRRFDIEGLVELLLPAEGLLPFETVIARYDGRLFWHERRDPRSNPALAAYLREALSRRDADELPRRPEQLRKKGLSREQREAYGLRWLMVSEERLNSAEFRLRRALRHAQARLRSYSERKDAYVVRFTVDGREHTSVVRKHDLTVLSAGVCLSGQDRSFDLASLVGVLRQGGAEGRLQWVRHA